VSQRNILVINKLYRKSKDLERGGWGEAHHSWSERMTSIYQIIRKLKIMYSIVHETQSMILCANIPHGFAKGGLHPTLQELTG